MIRFLLFVGRLTISLNSLFCSQHFYLSFFMKKNTKLSTSSAKKSKQVKEDDLVFRWVGEGEEHNRSVLFVNS